MEHSPSVWFRPYRRPGRRVRSLLVGGVLLALGAIGATAPRPAAAQGQASLVKDINQSGASVGADNLLVFGDRILFSGRDDGYGWELWTTDGTEAGTERVKDIRPGVENSFPGNLVAAGEVAYFTADDGAHGWELWRTDGTEAGTWMVLDLYPGATSSYPGNLVWSPALGRLVFSAEHPVYGYELWATDGTEGGTVLLADIEPGTGGSFPSNVVDRDGTIFFTAATVSLGFEVWATDGTPGGVVRVSDLPGNTFYRRPRSLTVYDGALYFAADDGSHGWELWRCDDPADGAAVIDLVPGPLGSNPNELTVSNGVLFFSAIEPGDTTELWRSDGTLAATARITDFGDDEYDSRLRSLIDVQGTLYFVGGEGESGRELWKSDGTTEGTVMVADINVGTCSANPEDLVAVGSRIYFEAREHSGKGELWVSDGSEAGTHRVKDIYPGPLGSAPRDMVAFGDRLIFTAIDGVHGRELWRSDGTEAGTELLADIFLRNLGSAIGERMEPLPGGGVAFLALTNFEAPFEIWRSDGSGGGTLRLPGTEGLAINSRSMVRLGSRLVFWADDGIHGAEPWSWDLLTSQATFLLDVGVDYGVSPHELVVAGNLAYFTTSWVPDVGQEIWRTDGTPGGTVLLKDIQPGGSGPFFPASSEPTWLTAVGDTLYFLARHPTDGLGLWKSDGTTEGTVRVKDLVVGPEPSPFGRGSGRLVAFGAKLFLIVDDVEHGAEPWVSDGTAEGTIPLGDLRPGPEGSGGLYRDAVGDGGLVYFVAEHPLYGAEPWITDGTPEGTRLLRDVLPGPASSEPFGFTRSGGRVFFLANDGLHGFQVWRTDGTTAGTQLLRLIRPVHEYPGSGVEMADVNGTLYLSIDDDEHGSELWTSDGTAEGTRIAVDVLPGPASSDPGQLTNASGRLFFSAFDPVRGREPWVLSCGNGVVETAEECDEGAANGSACCAGDCRLRTTPDLDGDSICDAGDPSDAPLALDRVVVRRRTARPAPDGTVLVVGSTPRQGPGDAISVDQGLTLEVRGASGVDHRTTWLASECRVKRSGAIRCTTDGRRRVLRAWPRGDGWGVRAIVKGLDLSGPFAGPVSVSLSHDGTIDRMATTPRCAVSPTGMTCRGG